MKHERHVQRPDEGRRLQAVHHHVLDQHQRQITPGQSGTQHINKPTNTHKQTHIHTNTRTNPHNTVGRHTYPCDTNHLTPNTPAFTPHANKADNYPGWRPVAPPPQVGYRDEDWRSPDLSPGHRSRRQAIGARPPGEWAPSAAADRSASRTDPLCRAVSHGTSRCSPGEMQGFITSFQGSFFYFWERRSNLSIAFAPILHCLFIFVSFV